MVVEAVVEEVMAGEVTKVVVLLDDRRVVRLEVELLLLGNDRIVGAVLDEGLFGFDVRRVRLGGGRPGPSRGTPAPTPLTSPKPTWRAVRPEWSDGTAVADAPQGRHLLHRLHPVPNVRACSRRPCRLSANGRVSEVVGSSSHRVLRMLLMPVPNPKQLTETMDRIRTAIDAAGLLSEWSGDRHVAVDIPPEAELSMLFDIMQREVSEGGAFWEWADAMAFSAQH